MKKIISGVLSAALVLSMGITALAQKASTDEGLNTTPDTNISDHTVDVTVEGADETPVYSVDVEWDSTDFTYTVGTSGTWDPDTHTYGTQDAGTWSNNGEADATVTNHSNAPVEINAQINGAASATKNGVTATVSIDSDKTEIATGVGRTYAEADSSTVSINVSGTPNTTDAIQVGTVTITISATA